MNLVKINLLPYREMQEQKQKKDFQNLMVLGGIIGVGVCAAIYTSLLGAIAVQNGRNESLQAGIKTLDGELEKIKSLNETKKNFLARKQKVEELDNKRFDAARMIDTLNQLVPDGAYLSALRSEANSPTDTAITNKYTVTGRAISDNKIAMFMNSLPSTGVFDTAQLVSIKKTDNGQEFELKSALVERKIIDNESASGVAVDGAMGASSAAASSEK